MFQKILCPVDLSDYSKPQIRYTRVLAESQGAALGVLHVIPIAVGLFDPAAFAQIQNEWDQIAEKQVRELCGEGIQLHFTHGVIANEIAAIAENQGYDLIVMPTHGYRGLKRFLLGSNFQSVLAKTFCPVYCLSPHFLEERSGEFRSPAAIVCYVEMAEGSEELIHRANILSRGFGASLTILHSPEIGDDIREKWVHGDHVRTESGDACEHIRPGVVPKGVDLVVFGIPSHPSHRVQMNLYRTVTELKVPALCVKV